MLNDLLQKKEFYYFILLFVIILYLINKNKETFENTKPIILITGTTSGIGKEFIKLYKNGNYRLLIHGRNCKKLKKLVEKYRKKDLDIEYVCYDLSKKSNVYKLVQEVTNKYKKIDIIINNLYDSTNDDDLEYQINTNLVNTILLTKNISPYISKKGKIINISSGLSESVKYHSNFISTYSIIKNSIEQFTKMLSSELYQHKIAVTCLRIDDSYHSKLTKKFLKNKQLKNPKEIINCLNLLIKINWKEITGKIIKSSLVVNNSILQFLDSNYKISNYPIYSIFNENKKNNKILGENIIPMSKNIKNIIKSKNWNVMKYVSETGKLKKYLSKLYKVNKNNICFHNGTINFLDKMINIFVKDNHQIITPEYTWGIFNLINQNKHILRVPYKIKNKIVSPNYQKIIDNINSHTRLIYLVSPIDKVEFDKFISKIPNNLPIIIDFCYNSFYPELLKSNNPIIDMGNYIYSNKIIIAVNTFSKFYSLPGIQLSFSVSSQSINNLIKQNFHYPISGLFEKIALTALKDKDRNQKTIKYYQNEKLRIEKILKNWNIKYYFTYQNTIFVYTNKSSEYITRKLREKNINLEIYFEDKYVNLPILTREKNDILLKLIK